MFIYIYLYSYLFLYLYIVEALRPLPPTCGPVYNMQPKRGYQENLATNDGVPRVIENISELGLEDFKNHQKSNLGAFRAAFGATSVTSRPQGERWILNLLFFDATWSILSAILAATGF